MAQPRPYRPELDIVPSVAAPRAPRNLSSRDGAEQLAHELDAWWHSRGFTQVHHRIEKSRYSKFRITADGQPTEDGTWTVRSNLIAGLPPKSERPQ